MGYLLDMNKRAHTHTYGNELKPQGIHSNEHGCVQQEGKVMRLLTRHTQTHTKQHDSIFWAHFTSIQHHKYGLRYKLLRHCKTVYVCILWRFCTHRELVPNALVMPFIFLPSLFVMLLCEIVSQFTPIDLNKIYFNCFVCICIWSAANTWVSISLD